MFSINDTIKKYVRFNPEIFAYTMLGLSTSILVYFVANNDESTNDKTGSGEIVPDEIRCTISATVAGLSSGSIGGNLVLWATMTFSIYSVLIFFMNDAAPMAFDAPLCTLAITKA